MCSKIAVIIISPGWSIHSIFLLFWRPIMYLSFLVLIIIYSSVNQNLLSLIKYKSEYFVPFSICSFLIISKIHINKINKNFFSFLIILFTIFNFIKIYTDQTNLKSNEYIINNYNTERENPFFYRQIQYDYKTYIII